jgi:glycosyltransferase involved in cell wall biosynthesis
MRVALFDQRNSLWTSGHEYTRAQAGALLAADEADVELVAICDVPAKGMNVGPHSVRGVAPPPIPAPGPVGRQVDRVVRRVGQPGARERAWHDWAEREGIDVVLSFEPEHWWQPSRRTTVCTWLPDFQEWSLPELYPEGEAQQIQRYSARKAEVGDLVVVSSETVRKDLAHFIPEHAHKARVFRFPSRFAVGRELPPPDLSVLERFHLDPRFVLVVNQFWRHKNHTAVVEAAGLLRREGRSCPQIVMIGMPNDWRDPGGEYLSSLLASIARYGLESQVKILGFVSAEERDALTRCCAALLQPSRFEGWNTSIEDAKAIGRPVIASGIDVHREQVPDAFGHFDPDDVEALAKVLEAASELTPGPDLELERAALGIARREAADNGRALLAICREAIRAKTA